jgi:hypothetical protein
MPINPNEFYSQEEKEEMADELRDREERNNAGESIFYIVVRTYRRKRFVRFISLNEAEAKEIFDQQKIDLRDGDLAVWKCVRHDVVARTSGGYNRTRW